MAVGQPTFKMGVQSKPEKFTAGEFGLELCEAINYYTYLAGIFGLECGLEASCKRGL